MNRPLLEARLTPDELLALADSGGYEVIDGQLVEKNMGAEAAVVGANVITVLGPHVRAHRLGQVFTQDCGYQIFPDDPNRVRKPDCSFIGKDHLPQAGIPRGNVRVVPDLVVEVVSPNDLAEEVEARVVDYLRVGVRLLWVFYPATRSVYVFRQGSVARLTAADELGGEDVIPGFACRVEELFAGI
jgi:Uma2 family endonuclease